MGALGSAGTPQAQQALASILGADTASREARIDAAVALGTTGQPLEASKRALVAASASTDPSLAGAATLGLGNLARNMTAQGTGDASDVIATLIQRLEAAADDADLLAWAAQHDPAAEVQRAARS